MSPTRVLALAALAAALCATPASADRSRKPHGKHPYPRVQKVTSPWLVPLVSDTRHIAGFRARGKTKVTDTTVGYLTHLHVGDPVRPTDIPKIEEALLSSELFEKIKVTLEDGPEGVLVVATVEDKLSWIAAPTLYVLPSNLAFGVGYVQNDLAGRDQKILLYGQVGTQTSLFVGAFLDPAVHGSKLYYRADVYLEHRHIDEYLNPPDDPTSQEIARTTAETFLDAGFMLGWNFRWWLGADLRFRTAYVYFRDSVDGAGNAVPVPEKDGWDTTLHAQITADHRVHRLGVATGAYAQLHVERSLPVVDTYQYYYYFARAYYSWRLFGEHELELRGIASGGYHMPMHEEVSLGGVSDLRGYATDQFRGDLNLVARAEYSVPLFKYRIFAFRALGFYDTGYASFNSTRSDRLYLPTQLNQDFQRSDAGVGFRVYVKNVVLPLLGLDVGYGIEGKSPELYFEVGLTDF